MKTVLLAGLGAVAIVSLTAFARVPVIHRNHAFTAQLTGDASAEFFGDASFARVEGGIGAPTVFTLDLGQESAGGAILFTRTSGSRLSLGPIRSPIGGTARMTCRRWSCWVAPSGRRAYSGPSRGRSRSPPRPTPR